MHRHDPLGKGVPVPSPLPPRDPSARRAGTHLADTRPLEQGPGGWRPRFTSVPLGKDAGAWPLPETLLIKVGVRRGVLGQMREVCECCRGDRA